MEQKQFSRIQIREIRKPWNRNSSPVYTVCIDQRDQETLEQEQFSSIQIREIRVPWNRNNSRVYRSEILGYPETGTVLQHIQIREIREP